MKNKLQVVEVDVKVLKAAEYNPRKWSESDIRNLTDSIKEFGLADPIIVNAAPKRKNIIIGGHFRFKVAKDLGYETVPVVYLNIADLEKEKKLNLRLNRNTGSFDFDILNKEFDRDLLRDIGFNELELENIFPSGMEGLPEIDPNLIGETKEKGQYLTIEFDSVKQFAEGKKALGLEKKNTKTVQWNALKGMLKCPKDSK